MTSRGAGRKKGKRGDGAGRGWMDVMGWQQLHTIEPGQAPPLCGYLFQTNKWGGQRQTNAWHVSLLWVTGKATVGPGPQTLGKHSWPRPRLPRCPLPYPTSDPTLRAICRSAPCRRPHDLIKCNYHQPLVLGWGVRGVSGGETSCSREKNWFIFAHLFQQRQVCFYLQTGITPQCILTIMHCGKRVIT